jgi:single-strand DNA-binding protein
MNRHDIIGRLGADPETKEVNGTSVANFSVATSERYKDRNGEKQEKTHWHNVVAWGKPAEIIAQYAQKGDRIFISGPSETRKWEDQDGNARYTTETRVRDFELLGGSTGEGGPGKPAPSSKPSNPSIAEAADDVDDDLPF